MKLLKISGKWYRILLMYDSYTYTSKLYDLENETDRAFIYWSLDQRIISSNEVWYGDLLIYIVKLIRFLKRTFTSNYTTFKDPFYE